MEPVITTEAAAGVAGHLDIKTILRLFPATHIQYLLVLAVRVVQAVVVALVQGQISSQPLLLTEAVDRNLDQELHLLLEVRIQAMAVGMGAQVEFRAEIAVLAVVVLAVLAGTLEPVALAVMLVLLEVPAVLALAVAVAVAVAAQHVL